VQAPVHQTPHQHPARAWAGQHPPGIVGEPAAGCIPSVPPPWVGLGPARGELLGPNSPLRPPPVPHSGFMRHWQGHMNTINPLNFPLGGAESGRCTMHGMHYSPLSTERQVHGGPGTAILNYYQCYSRLGIRSVR
jgi:hypothetical protein